MSENEQADVLLDRWQNGDEQAAEILYQRYAKRLSALAEAQLSERLGRRVGSDDIVQSVLRTFFRRARDGQFSIDHSGSLWRLLVTITLNKIRRQSEHHHAAKRDVNSELPGADAWLAETIARGPSATDVVMLNEELEQLLAGFDETEREILRLSLEGYTTPEIADRMGRSRWTIRRVLNRIGTMLSERHEKI